MVNMNPEAHKPSWWVQEEYTAWEPHDAWLKRETDFPQVEDLLKLNDESDKGVNWLNLYGKFTWEQPHLDGADYRWLWVDFMSCFVPNDEVKKFMNWIWSEDHTQEAIPEPPQYYAIYPII